MPMDKKIYEKTLERFSHILHPNHHIMVDMEFTLIQLLGRQQPSKSTNECKTVENERYCKFREKYGNCLSIYTTNFCANFVLPP